MTDYQKGINPCAESVWMRLNRIVLKSDLLGERKWDSKEDISIFSTHNNPNTTIPSLKHRILYSNSFSSLYKTYITNHKKRHNWKREANLRIALLKKIYHVQTERFSQIFLSA